MSIKDTMLRLSDTFYVPGHIIIFIGIAKLLHNDISVYFPPSQSVEHSFNRKIFASTDNIKDQVILWQSWEQLAFKINKPIIDLKIWQSWFVYLSYWNIIANIKRVIEMKEII